MSVYLRPDRLGPYHGSVNGVANNQMSTSGANATQGLDYDPSGDITDDGSNKYLCDGERRACAVQHVIPGVLTSLHPGNKISGASIACNGLNRMISARVAPAYASTGARNLCWA